jgi:hypothetical protein
MDDHGPGRPEQFPPLLDDTNPRSECMGLQGQR